MKKLSLFWKTWLITLFTILASITLFSAYLYYSTEYYVKNQISKNITENTQRISRYLEANGIDYNYLEKELQQGVFIQVKDTNGKVIFPQANEVVLEENTPDFNKTPNTSINQESNYINSIFNFNTHDGDKIKTPNGELYEISIFIFSANNTIFDFSIYITTFLPGFAIVAFIVSGIGSFLFANYFTKKIKNINHTIDSMSQQNISLPQKLNDGDELQRLENNLYIMYEKLQQSLSDLEKENEYSKKLENDRSIFMKGATHELKTPIMAMSSMLEGMIENVEGYENHEEYLVECYGFIQKMSQLVEEILEASRFEHLQFDGQINLKSIIEETLEIYEYGITDKNLHVHIDIDENIFLSMTEKNAKKVFSNLLSNCLKYTPDDGFIEILADKFEITILNDIPKLTKIPENIEQAFVFYNPEINEEIFSSHGLGLYIVDYILLQSNLQYNYEFNLEQQKYSFKIINTH